MVERPGQVDAYLSQLTEQHDRAVQSLADELAACRRQDKRVQTLLVAAEALRDEAVNEADAARAAAERDALEIRERAERSRNYPSGREILGQEAV